MLPAGTRENVLTHVATSFPLLDPSTLHSLTGSWRPVLVGVLTALWSGVVNLGRPRRSSSPV